MGKNMTLRLPDEQASMEQNHVILERLARR